jgi:pimeloyl-ACP methyl ester carboxylesterase
MIPDEMQLANDEVMVLEAELSKMLPRWETLNIPVTVIQGRKDRLVPPANADFAEQMLKHTKSKIVRVADAGHFILWKQPEIIRDAILEALDQNCQTNKIKQRAID